MPFLNTLSLNFTKSSPIDLNYRTEKVSTAREQVQQWIMSNLDEFYDLIFANIKNEELMEECLTSLLGMCRTLVSTISRDTNLEKSTRFLKVPLGKFFDFLLCQKLLGTKLTAKFKTNYLMVYNDILYYSLIFVKECIDSFKKKLLKIETLDFCKNIMAFLDDVVIPASFQLYFASPSETPVAKKVKVESLFDSESTYKRAFSDVWLSFLQMKDMPIPIFHAVLLKMNKSIIPLIENPFLLNDFITQSFSKGGDLAVLSMDSLYTLIIRYNLSYPNFYEKLYGIIAEDVFNQSRYSGQFKRLVHRFLSSTHLPEYIVASFIKKLARLTLFVPPHAILFILPLIYHLISEHSELKVLIHRMDEYKKMQEGPLLLANEKMEVFKGNDPFLFDELDLKKTNAMDSTLWEIDALDLHWNPMVSKMAQTFRSNMKDAKPGFKIYDFLQIDYKSLFDEETQVESSSEMEYDKTSKFEFNKLIF
jgi:hypothetical protein